jgi:hypothetical protein
MRVTRLASCLAIAGTFVAVAVVPVSAATPTVSATPNRKLADGQQVLVSASGFAANTQMAVVECPTATVSPSACDLNTLTFTTTDATGAYTNFPFTVSRILSDGTDCALNGGCYLGTQDAQAVGPPAGTLIKFNPKIPPLPPLQISVRWDETPRVNTKGVVALRGTLLCKNRAATVEIDSDLRQIFDGRAIFESFGFALVPCGANTASPFRTTIRPQNGLFGPGAAVLRFQAFANTVSVFGRRDLNLIGTGSAASPTVPQLPTGVWVR